jgi:Ni/Fe-hydrogenase subunit HybB-like protein
LKYLLPLLVLVAVVEGHGLILMGRHQLAAGLANHFPLTRVCLFELAQAGLLLLLLLGAAVFIKSFGNACHRRNHLSQGLFLVFHAVGPLLLLQLFNGLPIMNLFWVSWLVGITLTLCTLYHGLPRIMRPDPPSAMGLFLASSCVLCLLLFGARLFTYCYLARQLNASGAIFSGLPM